MKHLGDIAKIDCNNLEPVDIVTGGSPCQDLSVAGKRAGLAGARSGLFMEQIRIVRELREIDKRNGRTGEFIRPRFMVWENVPGAFSSNKGEDFRAVLEETARIADETVIIPGPPKGKWNTCGAIMGNGWSIAWRVLDAQYWGVPQRRRRIYLVADFGGQSAPEILFKRKGLSRYSQESGEARERIAADAERSVGKTSRSVAPFDTTQITSPQNGNKFEYGLPCHTLNANAHVPSIVELGMTHANDVVRECGQTVPTLQNRMGTGGNQIPLVQQINCQPSGISGTVSSKWAKGTGGPAGDEHYNLIAQRYSVRRLTPLECERLQGYPDGWTDIPGASDSARYKALGNSVAIPCVEYVLEGIKEVLEVAHEK